MRVIQHVKAPNDSNGNPRRLFLVVTGGQVTAYDEGFRGLIGAVPNRDGTELFLPAVNVTPT